MPQLGSSWSYPAGLGGRVADITFLPFDFSIAKSARGRYLRRMSLREWAPVQDLRPEW